MRKTALAVAVVVAVVAMAGCDFSGRQPSKEAVDLNNQAVRALDHGNLDQAIALANDAIKLEPTFSAAHANKAAILEKQGKLAEAAEVLSALVKADPDYAEAYIPLGVLLEKSGRVPEAEKHYAKALDLFTRLARRAAPEKKPGYEMNKAVAQFLLKDPQGAMATMEALLAANPAFEVARNYKERMETGRRDIFLNGPPQTSTTNKP